MTLGRGACEHPKCVQCAAPAVDGWVGWMLQGLVVLGLLVWIAVGYGMARGVQWVVERWR